MKEIRYYNRALRIVPQKYAFITVETETEEKVEEIDGKRVSFYGPSQFKAWRLDNPKDRYEGTSRKALAAWKRATAERLEPELRTAITEFPMPVETLGSVAAQGTTPIEIRQEPERRDATVNVPGVGAGGSAGEVSPEVSRQPRPPRQFDEGIGLVANAGMGAEAEIVRPSPRSATVGLDAFVSDGRGTFYPPGWDRDRERVLAQLEEISRAVQRFGPVAEAVERLRQTTPGIGHNNPPDAEPPLDKKLLGDASVAADVARTEISENKPSSQPLRLAARVLQNFAAGLVKLVKWAAIIGAGVIAKEAIKYGYEASGKSDEVNDLIDKLLLNVTAVADTIQNWFNTLSLPF